MSKSWICRHADRYSQAVPSGVMANVQCWYTHSSPSGKRLDLASVGTDEEPGKRMAQSPRSTSECREIIARAMILRHWNLDLDLMEAGPLGLARPPGLKPLCMDWPVLPHHRHFLHPLRYLHEQRSIRCFSLRRARARRHRFSADEGGDRV